MKFKWHITLHFRNEYDTLNEYYWLGVAKDLYDAEEQADLCLLAECPHATSIDTHISLNLEADKCEIWNECCDIEEIRHEI